MAHNFFAVTVILAAFAGDLQAGSCGVFPQTEIPARHSTHSLSNRLEELNRIAVRVFDLDLHEAERGDRAFIVYEAHTSTGKRFRNSEVYVVREGKLLATEVYFGWDQPHKVARGTHVESGVQVSAPEHV